MRAGLSHVKRSRLGATVFFSWDRRDASDLLERGLSTAGFGRSYRLCEGTCSCMSFFLSHVKITKKHFHKTQKTHIKPERLSKTQYAEKAHTKNAKRRNTPAKPRNDTRLHKKTSTRQTTVLSLGDVKLQPIARIPETRRRAKGANTLRRHHRQTSLRKVLTCLRRIYPGPQLPR